MRSKEYITAENNLSSSNVYSFFRDRQGKLWVGTDYGLSAWDGYTATQYRSDNPDVRITSRMTQIIEWDGKLILSGYFKGLCYFDPQTREFGRYKVGRGADFSGYSLDTCVLDEDNILFASGPSGIFRYNRKTGKSTAVLTEQGVVHGKCIEKDSKGGIWMGSWGGGFYRYDEKVGLFRKIEIPTDDEEGLGVRINEIVVNDKGQVILGVWGYGVFVVSEIDGVRLVKSQGVPAKVLPTHSLHISTLSLGRDGNVYCGSEYGIDVLERSADGSFAPHPRESAMEIDDVTKLLYDDEGLLWVGTRGFGFTRLHIRAGGFDYLPCGTDETIGEEASDIKRFDENNLLFVYRRKGLSVFNIKEGRSLPIKESPVWPAHLKRPVRPGTNRITFYNWGGRRMALTGTDYQGFDLYGLDDPGDGSKGGLLSYTELWFYGTADIATDHKGRIWVAHNYKLTVFEPVSDTIDFKKSFAENFRVIEPLAGTMLESMIKCLVNQDNKVMWIGSNNNGLLSVNMEKPTAQALASVRQYKRQGNFPGLAGLYSVDSLLLDAQKRLWVGTRGEGLCLLDETQGVIQSVKQTHALGQSHVKSINQSLDGKLWLGTGNGLYSYKPDDAHEEHFSTIDGLVANGFASRASYFSAEGTAYMGTIAGVVRFDPASVRDSTYIPQPSIERLSVLCPGESRDIGFGSLPEKEGLKVIEIHAPAYGLEIAFSALSMKGPEHNQYKYRLLGLEEKWSSGNRNWTVNYSNLPEGTYVFEVLASNNSGRWCETPVRLRIVMIPDFWRTRWFRIMVVVLLLLGVIAGALRRIHRVKLLNIELERRVAERTGELQKQNEKLESVLKFKSRFLSLLAHDLRNPMGSLISYADVTVQSFDTMTDADKRDFAQQTLETSNTLLALLNRLLELGNIGFDGKDSSSFEAVEVGSVIGDVIAVYAGNHKQVRIVSMSPQTPSVWGDRRLIEFVLRNLVGNALKFSQRSSEIAISVKVDGRFLSLLVRDQGIGMSARDRENLFNPEKTRIKQGTAGEQGSGLGLVACKEFVERMGGEIFVESEEGKGSTFTFTVPLAKQLVV